MTNLNVFKLIVESCIHYQEINGYDSNLSVFEYLAYNKNIQLSDLINLLSTIKSFGLRVIDWMYVEYSARNTYYDKEYLHSSLSFDKIIVDYVNVNLCYSRVKQ